MMPVPFAALGEGPAVRVISGGIEQFPGRSIAGDAIALEIPDMGTQRAGRAHPADDARLDHGATGACLPHSRRRKARGASTSQPPAPANRTTGLTPGLPPALEPLPHKRLCPRPPC